MTPSSRVPGIRLVAGGAPAEEAEVVQALGRDTDAQRSEVDDIADQLDALLNRIDTLGFGKAGNHISHGLELLRQAAGRADNHPY